MTDIEVKMDEIKSSNELKHCIHGTYYKFWPSIQVQV